MGRDTAGSMAAVGTEAGQAAPVGSRTGCRRWAFAESKDCRPDTAAWAEQDSGLSSG